MSFVYLLGVFILRGEAIFKEYSFQLNFDFTWRSDFFITVALAGVHAHLDNFNLKKKKKWK